MMFCIIEVGHPEKTPATWVNETDPKHTVCDHHKQQYETSFDSYDIKWKRIDSSHFIPFRVCCGKPHLGPMCPDGKVMCCMCFERVEQNELAIDPTDGMKWDYCLECEKKEQIEIKRRGRLI